LVKSSSAAKALEKEIGEQLPLSSVVDGNAGPVHSFVKWVYGDALPFFPGTDALNKQVLAADRAIMKKAVKMATPEGMNGKDVKTLEKAFVDGYESSIGKYSLPDAEAIPWGKMSEAASSKVQKLVKDYTVDGGIDGKSIPKLRAALGELADTSDLPGIDGVVKSFDGHVNKWFSGIRAGGKTRDRQFMLKIYNGLNEKYDNFRRVAHAASKADGLTTANLADSATALSPLGKQVSKTGPMQDFAERAKTILGKDLPAPSLWGRIASLNAVNLGKMGWLGGLGAAGGLAGPAIAYAGGKALSTKTAQNILLGRSGFQRYLKKAGDTLPTSPGSVAGQYMTQQDLEEEGY